MANKPLKAVGAPRFWDSMAGFLPAFVGGMAIILAGMMLVKA